MSWSDIPGYSGFLWLYDEFVANANDGAVVVEVGVALGHSLAYLARKVIDSGKRIEVWGVDPWAGYARNGEQQAALGVDGTKGDFTLFLEQMRRHAPEELEYVRIVRAMSGQAARIFDDVDLVLIDAAHDYRSVTLDIASWESVICPGGTLAGDDHGPTYPGVEQACRALFGNGYEVRGTTWVRRCP